MYTQAHSENKNTVGEDVPPNPFDGVGALEGTVSRFLLMLINIKFTNGNMSI